MLYSHLDYTLKTLRLLAFSGRPVLIEEVAEAIAVDFTSDVRFDPDLRLNNIDDILTVCSSLVTITTRTVSQTAISKTYKAISFSSGPINNATSRGEEYVTVRELALAHFSVKEWLASERTARTLPFLSGLAENANDMIAQTCLSYIHYVTGFSNMPKLNADDFPFINYAMQYWSHHLRCCEDTQYSDSLESLSLALLSVDTSQSENLACLGRMLHGRFQSQMRFNPLYWSCYAGLYKLSRLYLEHGANINMNTEGSGSPLHAAIVGADARIVQLLIDNGADVSAFKTHAWTDSPVGYLNALQFAAYCCNEDALRILIAMDTNTDAKSDRYGQVLIAATYDLADTKILHMLLEAGADVNTQSLDGTALCAACLLKTSDQTQVVELLLGKGANPNLRGGVMDTPLHAATLQKDNYLIEQLLDHGAEREVEDRYGWTPLQCARTTRNLKGCQLLSAGKDNKIMAQDDGGWPSLYMIPVTEDGDFVFENDGTIAVVGKAPLLVHARLKWIAEPFAENVNQERLDEGIQARGSHCLPFNFKAFYFEVSIVSGGKRRYVFILFSSVVRPRLKIDSTATLVSDYVTITLTGWVLLDGPLALGAIMEMTATFIISAHQTTTARLIARAMSSGVGWTRIQVPCFSRRMGHVLVRELLSLIVVGWLISLLATIAVNLERRLFPLYATSEPGAKVKVNLGSSEFVYKNLLTPPGDASST